MTVNMDQVYGSRWTSVRSVRTVGIVALVLGCLATFVALLGRNTAVGVALGALLFGGLLFGTTHGLQSNVIDPQAAGNLTYIIQGLIVLFVGADVLILSVWNARRKLRRSRPASTSPAQESPA